MIRTGIEKALDYGFKRKELLIAAITHPSSPDLKANGGLFFQRLEFLGDSIINSFIAFEIYKMFPDANEGTLSRFRSILVSKKMLAEIAVKLKLKKFLRLGERERGQLKIIPSKILSDAFEALVAAIYLDCGRKKTEHFLARSFKPYLKPNTLVQFTSHPKSILQEYSQKMWRRLPIYESRLGTRKKMFQTRASIHKKMAQGSGRTKQEAEADAAMKLIRKLKISL